MRFVKYSPEQIITRAPGIDERFLSTAICRLIKWRHSMQVEQCGADESVKMMRAVDALDDMSICAFFSYTSLGIAGCRGDISANTYNFAS